MSDFANGITRRDFLRGATHVGLAAAMGLPIKMGWAGEETKVTRVVLIRNAEVTDEKGAVNGEIIRQMLDRAVTALFDMEKPLDAWKKLVKPSDYVGIKSNEWGPLPTPLEMEQAIQERLEDAGVSPANIDINDRGVLGSKIFLKSTVLINVRPLRTHHWAGIGGCIKNYIMFVPRPQDYHDNYCADLAAIWKKPMVKDKTRLNILLLLQPLFHGIGPHHFDKTYVWDYKGILVGVDPVALDAIGLQIFDAKRRAYFGKARPLQPPAHHVAYADIKHKLGTSDLRKIDLVKLGWQKDILI